MYYTLPRHPHLCVFVCCSILHYHILYYIRLHYVTCYVCVCVYIYIYIYIHTRKYVYTCIYITTLTLFFRLERDPEIGGWGFVVAIHRAANLAASALALMLTPSSCQWPCRECSRSTRRADCETPATCAWKSSTYCFHQSNACSTVTANLRTNITYFRGFDSSIILILRAGISRPKGNFPENLSRAILVGTILGGRLGVPRVIMHPDGGPEARPT